MKLKSKFDHKIRISIISIITCVLLAPMVMSVQEIPENYQFEGTENTFILMNTSMGSMKISLYDDFAPETVQNFLDLMDIDFFDGLVFHRVIDDFVIQGGGFDSNGIDKQSPFGPIDLEIHPDARHIDGALGMARTSDPNSATSQFYICDGPQHFLDDNYAVFGVVVEGMNVVRNIASVDTTTRYGFEDWPIEDVTINSISIVTSDTWYVDDDNTEGPWYGTSDYPFQFIQDALDQAKANDKIIVKEGIYDEALRITTPVDLIGQSTENTILTSTDSDGNLVVENASFTRIGHFSFQSNQQGPLTAIKLIQSNYCTIEHVDFTNQIPLHTAVYVNGSYNTLNKLNIDGGYAGTGISIFHGKENIIKDNMVNACTVGVYVLRSNENIARSNTIINCSKGFYLEEGQRNLVTNNQIQENEQGMFCSYASDNTIEKNNFIANDEQAKFAKFLKLGFLIPNHWSMNYWDDFTGVFFKPIFGLLYVPIGKPIGFFLPCYEFDFSPTGSPYQFL